MTPVPYAACYAPSLLAVAIFPVVLKLYLQLYRSVCAGRRATWLSLGSFDCLIHHVANMGPGEVMLSSCSFCCVIQVLHAISVDRKNCVGKKNANAAPSVMWSKIALVTLSASLMYCSRCMLLLRSIQRPHICRFGSCPSKMLLLSGKTLGRIQHRGCSWPVDMLCHSFTCIDIAFICGTCTSVVMRPTSLTYIHTQSTLLTLLAMWLSF